MRTREFLRWLTGLSNESLARQAIGTAPREITSMGEANAITARLSS